MKPRPLLKSGDVLGVCAPSARFENSGLNQGIRVLKDLGFRVHVPEEIYQKKRYLAGEDIVRADTINRLFSAPDIDGIICARGGFGAMRILDKINWQLIQQHPKPFIGFSDGTALLLSIIEKTNNLVIHGPTVVSLPMARQQTLDSLYQALTEPLGSIRVTQGQIIHPGQCKGILKGGNLATISHLLGTRYQPDFNHSILFLEDIGEPAYKIDRMLTQMKMAGMFNSLKGVITGSFENCSNEEYIQEIFFEVFDGFHIPVLSGIAAGHGRINLSLCMGDIVEMDTADSILRWK